MTEKTILGNLKEELKKDVLPFFKMLTLGFLGAFIWLAFFVVVGKGEVAALAPAVVMVAVMIFCADRIVRKTFEIKKTIKKYKAEEKKLFDPRSYEDG